MSIVFTCKGCSDPYEAGDLYILEVHQPAYTEDHDDTLEAALCEGCIAELSEPFAEVLGWGYEEPEEAPQQVTAP